MKIPSLKAEKLAQLIGVASDVAMLLDKKGVIQDVSVRPNELTSLGCHHWVGRKWVDTVTSESRDKVNEMLKPGKGGADLRWRHINHPVEHGEDMPIQYTALHIEADGKTLVLGRDMEAIAVLQRRLVQTQQAMERDYLRLRHIESRYKILFDTSRDPVLMVDAQTQKVTEANIAAQSLLKDPAKRLVGRDLIDCFDPADKDEVQALMRMAHATGRIEMARVKFAATGQEVTLSVTVFRQDSGAHFLVRLLQAQATPGADLSHPQALFAEAMAVSPDGLVLTDRAGQIQSVNSEFMAMLGATTPAQLQGQAFERLLVRGGVDWGVLHTHLRQKAAVKSFATELHAMSGLSLAVEISAVTLSDKESSYAFYVRDVSRRRQEETPAATSMAGSVAELAHLVGRMPMKDIVSETAEMIERMCIQSALQLTHNNRASAAEMLGLSRQSLYVKLRRFGMIDDGDDD